MAVIEVIKGMARRRVMNYSIVELENDEQSIVDCIYEVGEKVDLKEFLNSYRNPYPIYFIAEAICNEMPEKSLKYKEIKRFIDDKLEMKRGCRYDAVIRIVWAAIRYTYPNTAWDELLLKFKNPKKRPIITLIKEDSIEENIERAKLQSQEYFDAHDNVPQYIKDYIGSTVYECKTINELKYMIGNIFNVRMIEKDEEIKE